MVELNKPAKIREIVKKNLRNPLDEEKKYEHSYE